jgi:hypothetical protein
MNFAGLRQTVAPYATAVALAEAKAHLRVDGADEDETITALIRAAQKWCEDFQKRQFVTATWKLSLDRLPNALYGTQCHSLEASGGWFDNEAIVLPRPPLVSVTSIVYTDTNGDSQTLAAADYRVDTEAEPGRITPAYNEFWPSTREQTNAAAVTYIAGSATPFTAVAATDVLTWKGRSPTLNDLVRVTNSGGTLPVGLSADTDYNAVNVSGATCKLSLTEGGAAVDITSTGSGTHFIGAVPPNAVAAMKLLIGHLYENREHSTEMALKEIPMGVESLLWPDRVF